MKLSLGEIADQFDLEVVGEASTEIRGIANIADAVPGDLTFLFSPSYKKHLETSRASAVVIRDSDITDCDIPALISAQPRLEWANIAALFDGTPPPDKLQHETAVIGSGVSIGEGVSIGANSVIADGAVLADGVCIGAGCSVGARTELGSGTRLHANVTLYHDVKIGSRCLIHSGAVLGADGFGFEFDSQTATLVKIPQVYGVHIGDDVEIGALTTIDRGALNHTVIGKGVKLDNQVQIGHGVSIGAHTAISGCTAIAGSTRVGSYCLIGGGVGMIDNIEVADQVEITARTLVTHSITEKGRYSSGTPLMKSRDWKRSVIGIRKLDDLIKRIRRLEKK